MARLLLWDVDGTLLTTGSVSRDAFHAAVAKVLDRDVRDEGLSFSGKTDPSIAGELLRSHGVDDDDDMAALVKRVLRALGPALAERRARIPNEGRVMHGVREVLAALDDTAALTTVLTGNIAVNAVCKLDAFRMTSHFDLEVGAFGSDRAERAELVDVARQRALQKRHARFESDEIWIIGDTPLDQRTAAVNGVRCLLVASGTYDVEALEGLGADAVLPDLSDVDRVLRVLFDV